MMVISMIKDPFEDVGTKRHVPLVSGESTMPFLAWSLDLMRVYFHVGRSSWGAAEVELGGNLTGNAIKFKLRGKQIHHFMRSINVCNKMQF